MVMRFLGLAKAANGLYIDVALSNILFNGALVVRTFFLLLNFMHLQIELVYYCLMKDIIDYRVRIR